MKKVYAAIYTLIVICILLIVLLNVTGCGTGYENATACDSEYAGGYFTVIKKWGTMDTMANFHIAYANDTHVMYLIKSGRVDTITPLMNPDGTCQVYNVQSQDQIE